MSTIVASAEHWETIASHAEEIAMWNRVHGFDNSIPGESTGDYQAKIYRRCAHTLRLQAETGFEHCICHMAPKQDCPSGDMGLLIGTMTASRASLDPVERLQAKVEW